LTVVENQGDTATASVRPAEAPEATPAVRGNVMAGLLAELKQDAPAPVTQEDDDGEPTTARFSNFEEDQEDDEPVKPAQAAKPSEEDEEAPVPRARFKEVNEEKKRAQAEADEVRKRLAELDPVEVAVKARGFKDTAEFLEAWQKQDAEAEHQKQAQALQQEYDNRENLYGAENAEEWRLMKLEAIRTQNLLKQAEQRHQQFEQQQAVTQARDYIGRELAETKKAAPAVAHATLDKIFAQVTLQHPQYASELRKDFESMFTAVKNDVVGEYAQDKGKDAARLGTNAGRSGTIAPSGERVTEKPGTRGVGAALMDFVKPRTQ
jgi:hypothetical protein